MTINYIAVLVCAIASMVIGFVWYGPLFGKVWMREIMGSESMTHEQSESMKKGMWGYYLIQFILSLITAGFLAVHIANWADVTVSALAIAVCTWFGFVMTTIAGGSLWSGKPRRTAWKMFLITAGAQLVTFIVFGLILGAWM